MSVFVHEVNIHDNKEAPEVIENLSYKCPRLVKILADVAIEGILQIGFLISLDGS